MTWRIEHGDCREVMAAMEPESVQACVTSPAYWRQRDYGHPEQLGLERTPEEYVARLAGIMEEVRRVLRKDGTLWLNLGDKWASGGKGGGGSFMEQRSEAWAHAKNAKGWRSPPAGYKDKDLVGLPFMVAFALRARGWYWRQTNIWAKPNGMPESVTDRSTISHEYVLHFSKSNTYYYDDDAARTPASPATETRLAQRVEQQAGSDRANGGRKTNGPMKAVARKGDAARPEKQRGHSRRHAGFNDRWDQISREQQVAGGANLRSVWWVAPAQFGGAHFAVMPTAIAELCIVPSTRPGDTVLDPFAGAGTTLLVADRLGRNGIGVELNAEYVEMARRRIAEDAPLFSRTE